MYSLTEYGPLTQRNGEDRLEGATDHPSKSAREDRRTGPYVVRDLSWELARYLDAEDLSAGASATPNPRAETRPQPGERKNEKCCNQHK
jgi:hypothetical protein